MRDAIIMGLGTRKTQLVGALELPPNINEIKTVNRLYSYSSWQCLKTRTLVSVTQKPVLEIKDEIK